MIGRFWVIGFSSRGVGTHGVLEAMSTSLIRRSIAVCPVLLLRVGVLAPFKPIGIAHCMWQCC